MLPRVIATVLSAIFALHGVGRAASPEPDRVSLGKSTIAWSTVKYALTAGNGFVRWSLDQKPSPIARSGPMCSRTAI